MSHSAEIAVDVETLQLHNAGVPLFPAPIAMHCATGVLNIVVGPNGTGKTRILDILSLRKIAPADAVIRRAGHEKSTEIAYLPQAFFDILDIRVKDIFRLASGPRSANISLAPPRVLDIMSSRNVELGALSGGQMQLLLFWLVSSQPLRVHIYDEPFRHLDDEACSYVASTIEEQVGQGRLVVISEHSAGTPWGTPCNRQILGKHGVV